MISDILVNGRYSGAVGRRMLLRRKPIIPLRINSASRLPLLLLRVDNSSVVGGTRRSLSFRSSSSGGSGIGGGQSSHKPHRNGNPFSHLSNLLVASPATMLPFTTRTSIIILLCGGIGAGAVFYSYRSGYIKPSSGPSFVDRRRTLHCDTAAENKVEEKFKDSDDVDTVEGKDGTSTPTPSSKGTSDFKHKVLRIKPAERETKEELQAKAQELQKETEIAGAEASAAIKHDAAKRTGQDGAGDDISPWQAFSEKIDAASEYINSLQWSKMVADIPTVPWANLLPSWVAKFQQELNMEPGSLAHEVVQESSDPSLHPEIEWDARVRISEELCEDEKKYLRNRKQFTKAALAKYLEIPEDEIHEDDVPIIAMCGSGGGLRATVAGAGSMDAVQESGLFDCATYIVGVSGSCWLWTLYYTIGKCSFKNVIEHLKHRIQTHIAYPPAVFELLNTAPTNKYLLRGVIERLKQGYNRYGLVDSYGLLIAGRLLVPKDEISVDDSHMKLSAQRQHVDSGKQPLPIYTAVRHEIPGLHDDENITDEAAKERAQKEAWFEFVEMTPYELFIEEFGAGIPTWAMGRQFKNGTNVNREPEMKIATLVGIWGSAMCATLSHYYQEVRPLVSSLKFFSHLDRMIQERNDDLIKVHPIDPGGIPNFVLGLKDELPSTCPASVHKTDTIDLLDAGMSDNLGTYPLLRPGRDVDILVCFDSSADIKTANWISLTEGYAKQRGLKGWPVGIGWPREDDPHPEVALDEHMASDAEGARDKLEEAKKEDPGPTSEKEAEEIKMRNEGLGYLTVWVGTKEERESDGEPPSSKAVDEDWELTHPSAGVTIAYWPLIANPEVPGVSTETSDFLSTWNFEYTPEQIEKTTQLARANFKKGEDKMKRTVRAVYERKKKMRLEEEQKHDVPESRDEPF